MLDERTVLDHVDIGVTSSERVIEHKKGAECGDERQLLATRAHDAGLADGHERAEEAFRRAMVNPVLPDESITDSVLATNQQIELTPYHISACACPWHSKVKNGRQRHTPRR